jgi:GxxExxY protein
MSRLRFYYCHGNFIHSVYEVVLASELTGRGLKVARQVAVPITYKGIKFDEGFRADLIVEDKIIEEKPLCASAPLREKRTDSQLPTDM